MKTTFAAKKLNTLILANLVQLGLYYLALLFGNIVAGNLLGADALGAVSLASPFVTLTGFVGNLSVLGSSALISLEVGRQNTEGGNRYFGQGLILSVGAAALLTLAYLFIALASPNLFGVSEEMNRYFREYFWYICFFPLVKIPGTYLFTVAMNEGGEAISLVTSAIHAVAMVLLSWVLCLWMGVGGIGLATLLSYALSRVPLFFFMAGSKFALRPRWYFNARAAAKAVKIAVGGSSVSLYSALMRLVLNVYLLGAFGEAALVVFTVAMGVYELILAVCNSVGMSISPLINLYRGENMQTGTQKAMRHAGLVSLWQGVALTLVLLVFAGGIAGLFGIQDPALVAQAAASVRIFSVCCLPAALVLLFIYYYSFAEQEKIALLTATLFLLVLPVGMGIALGAAAGPRGVWWGIALSGAVSLALLWGLAKRAQRGRTFPLFLEKARMAEELSYDVPRTKDGVMKLLDLVERDLNARGLDAGTLYKIMLMIEETEMLAIATGPKKRAVVECGILFEEEILLLLHDSSSATDPGRDETHDTRENRLESYIPLMLIGMHQQRSYTLAGGKTRLVYRFPNTVKTDTNWR